MAFAVIRIRGGIKSAEGVEETLGYLNLTRVNHCTVIPQTPSYKGMLQKVKDYVTWGEISPATLEKLIALKGEMTGRKKITDADLKSISNYPSIKALAEALAKDEASYNQLKSVRPLFRLSPPIRGYEGVKNHYNPSHPSRGGSLGYRGEAINKLLEKMLPDALENKKKA
ncbi:MAG: 50S ribosomal protein L30, partial [Candidatus Thermoplasmatota archaeon]|nr:50S ribosomal protein L30 [Candidatus Thermoplasmatota archaeon]